MLQNLLSALRQFDDRRIQKLLLLSIAVAIGVLIVLTIASQWLLDTFANTGWTWLNWIVQIAGLGGAAVLAYLLFPILMSAVIGLFLDQVIDAVEDRHYPGLIAVRQQPVGETIAGAIRFAAIALGANVLVLPLYLIPGANIPIFLALNGYLLGREYFEQIAVRRMPAREARSLRRRNQRRCWLAGIVLAVMLLIPFFNLVASIAGIAFMTLNMHKWKLFNSDDIPSAA